jgi:hypothetical protein
MYTVLIILSSDAIETYNVQYFETKEQAEEFQPVGVGCDAKVGDIYEGQLSADAAICEYLD